MILLASNRVNRYFGQFTTVPFSLRNDAMSQQTRRTLFVMERGIAATFSKVVLGQMPEEFYSVFMDATDETITELLGPVVLSALYAKLANRYDVTRDELPFRMDTAIELLENVFGVKGARTIGRSIVRRFYRKLNVEFREEHDHSLDVYLKIAQRELAKR